MVPAISRVANNHVAAVLCSVMTGCVLVCTVHQLMSCYQGCEVVEQGGTFSQSLKGDGERKKYWRLINDEEIYLIL